MFLFYYGVVTLQANWKPIWLGISLKPTSENCNIFNNLLDIDQNKVFFFKFYWFLINNKASSS